MNGLLYDFFNAAVERAVLHAIREAVLPPLFGRVVEIGAGTGASFSYYPAGATVIAIEPDPSMLSRALRRVSASRAAIELVRGDDAVLDAMPEASVDAIVFCLVLCSVKDPVHTLRRARRVLKPDGRFVFIEHVRSNGPLGRLQDAVTPLWRRVAGNCHLNRRTEGLFALAGFCEGETRRRRLLLRFPIEWIIYGTRAPAKSG